MFHVLVLGGFALVGCGGAVASNAKAPAPDDAGGSSDGAGGSGEGSPIATGDGWIPIEGPQLLGEAGAVDAWAEALAGALADASGDAIADEQPSACDPSCCIAANCCFVVCVTPVAPALP
jgi:hypothetical protein